MLPVLASNRLCVFLSSRKSRAAASFPVSWPLTLPQPHSHDIASLLALCLPPHRCPLFGFPTEISYEYRQPYPFLPEVIPLSISSLRLFPKLQAANKLQLMGAMHTRFALRLRPAISAGIYVHSNRTYEPFPYLPCASAASPCALA